MNPELIEQIKSIGYSGHGSRGTDYFLEVAEKMSSKGFADEEIFEIIDCIYSSVASDFGC